ncbi:ketose-bisphosphate aldolases family protein, partial [Yersinia pestis PY-94]
MKQRLKWLFPA